MNCNGQLRLILRDWIDFPLYERLQAILFTNSQRVSFAHIPRQKLTDVGSTIQVNQAIDVSLIIPLKSFIWFAKRMTIIEITRRADQFPESIIRNIKWHLYRNRGIGFNLIHTNRSTHGQINFCLISQSYCVVFIEGRQQSCSNGEEESQH